MNLNQKNQYPLVSVFCFVKNSANTIRRCVESVITQDYKNFEFIIQDGASTDGTVEIIKSYNDPRIKLVSEPDTCTMDAYRKILKRIKGEIVASCLADEELLPHALSWGVKQLKNHPEAVAVYGDFYVTDIDGNIRKTVRAADWNFEKYICTEITPPFCSAFFRAKQLIESTAINNVEYIEVEIWIRLGMNHKILHIPNLVSKYAVHENERGKKQDKAEKLKERRYIIETICSEPSTPDFVKKLKQKAIDSLYVWITKRAAECEQWNLAYEYAEKAFSRGHNTGHLRCIANMLFNRALHLEKTGNPKESLDYTDLLIKCGVQGKELQVLRQRLGSDSLSQNRIVSNNIKMNSRYDRIYFYHVRKAGGTSINHMFMSLGGEQPEKVYQRVAQNSDHKTNSGGLVYAGWNKDVVSRGDYFYAHSHATMQELNLPEKTFTFTCLRDPVKRILSHYKMLMYYKINNINHPGMKLEGKFLGNSFQDFITLFPKHLMQHQLFMFSRRYNVSEAMENVLSLDHFMFTDDFKYGIMQLCKKTELNLTPLHKRKAETDFSVSPGQIKILEHKLEPEIQFINKLKKHYFNSSEKPIYSGNFRFERFGTHYGGWHIVPELITKGSTVISAGIGEDISFDRALISIKNCDIVGIDPTPKAAKYVEKCAGRKFLFLDKALHSAFGHQVRMYKNSNPEHVSESVLKAHQSVKPDDFYNASTIDLETIQEAFENISLIKMDIEGAEYDVLLSLKSLNVPQVCVEFHHFCTDYSIEDTKMCIKHMQQLGYTTILNNDQQRPLAEITFVHKSCRISSFPDAAEIIKSQVKTGDKFAEVY